MRREQQVKAINNAIRAIREAFDGRTKQGQKRYDEATQMHRIMPDTALEELEKIAIFLEAEQ